MNLIEEARIFIISAIAATSFCMHGCFHTYLGNIATFLTAFLQIYLLYKHKKNLQLFQVSIRVYLLVIVFHCGRYLSNWYPDKYLALGYHLSVVSAFHLGEYLVTAIFQPSTVTLDSFILNHSKEFNIAMATSVAEYFVVQYFLPAWQLNPTRIYLGLTLSLFGDFVRKVSMVTAGESFTHLVQHMKRDEHILITSGVYSVVRHPSYGGWFLWSVATQLMLGNFLCFIGFMGASWKFFSERIEFEEFYLVKFFGEDYASYKEKVPFSGVPFCNGFNIVRKRN